MPKFSEEYLSVELGQIPARVRQGIEDEIKIRIAIATFPTYPLQSISSTLQNNQKSKSFLFSPITNPIITHSVVHSDMVY